MDFGLLPKFSTPVEKPVENAGILAVTALEGLILRQFFEAKARRSRFEAPFRAAHPVPSGFTGLR
jgi:hypothetical protein